MSFARVLVVGAGQMGAGIAQVVAASGRRVSLHDPFPGATERALETIVPSLERLARERRARAPTSVLARIAVVDDLVAADLMIEAVVEDAAVKEDAVSPRRRAAAGPTRCWPRTRARSRSRRSLPATGRPGQVIGMHFFNPVPVLALVEVIRAEQTSDETAAAIVALARDARQGAGRGARRRRVRLQPDPDALHQRGRSCARRRRRRGGGDRHGREARVRPPDRARSRSPT